MNADENVIRGYIFFTFTFTRTAMLVSSYFPEDIHGHLVVVLGLTQSDGCERGNRRLLHHSRSTTECYLGDD